MRLRTSLGINQHYLLRFVLGRMVSLGGDDVTKIEFRTKLVRGEGWVCLNFPPSADKKLTVKGRVPVTGTINGFPIRTSAFFMGGKTHMILVNKEMQTGARVGAGDTVAVSIEVDTRPRTISVPPDLRKAIAKSAAAKAAFDKLSYTHRKEYVRWIEEAKKGETRSRRIGKAVAMLSKGTKTPD